jgi:hypothetical protein
MKLFGLPICYIVCVMEMRIDWNWIQTVIRKLEFLFKCNGKQYVVKNIILFCPTFLYHVMSDYCSCCYHLLHIESYWNWDTFLLCKSLPKYRFSDPHNNYFSYGNRFLEEFTASSWVSVEMLLWLCGGLGKNELLYLLWNKSWFLKRYNFDSACSF